MKVKITVELEVPDEIGNDLPTIRQALFDAYVNYVPAKHFEDALEWCAAGNIGLPNEDLIKKQIYKHHRMWGKITSDAKARYEVENE